MTSRWILIPLHLDCHHLTPFCLRIWLVINTGQQVSVKFQLWHRIYANPQPWQTYTSQPWTGNISPLIKPASLTVFTRMHTVSGQDTAQRPFLEGTSAAIWTQPEPRLPANPKFPLSHSQKANLDSLPSTLDLSEAANSAAQGTHTALSVTASATLNRPL